MSAALRQDIPHALDGMTDAYVVGNLDNDPDRLPFWGKVFVKYVVIPLEAFAHRRWKWSCQPQLQTVCKTVPSAEKMIGDRRRWFWSKVPVEPVVLSDEPAHYGHSYPNSPRAAKYESLAHPEPVTLHTVGREAERLRERLERSV